MTKSLWDEYLETAREKYEVIEREERYKIDLAEALANARKAWLNDEPDWLELVTAAIKHKHNNLINWRNLNKLKKCIANYPDEVREALREMWSEEDRTPGDRIRAFDSRLSEDMLDIPPTATGTRLRNAAYFMMGLGVHQYPPYQERRFQSSYKELGYPEGPQNDAGEQYEHALGFLDHMLKEARQRDMNKPATRMDAQSILFWQSSPPAPPPTTIVSEPETPYRADQTTHPLNTILYGPPGTGKTWHTVTRTVAIIEGRGTSEVEKEARKKVKRQFEEYRDSGHIEMVTFHQNATYEDFIEGIRPVLTETDQAHAKDQTGANGQASPDRSSPGDIQYEMRPGVFRRIAKRAQEHPDQRYVLVIDEINRGNIARIFGELITLIEDTKRQGEDDEARVTLPGSQDEFSVPSNLYILGTMNTADRSIALLDTALRRRFTFEEMMPDPSHKKVNKIVDNVDYGKLLKAINRRIAVLLDRDHQIGHTYFLGVKTTQALAKAFQHSIVPLLQEYFYDDWEKIQAVLNDNGFVKHTSPPNELVQANLADENQKVYNLLPRNDTQWTNPAAYQAIYGKPASPSSADNKANDGAAEGEGTREAQAEPDNLAPDTDADREAQAGPDDRTPGTVADREPQND